MKTKVVLFAAAGLLAVGVGFHVSGNCPLRQMMGHAAKHTTAPANPNTPETQTSLTNGK